MIATGRSISHGREKANYDAKKIIEDVKVATELCRHNVYGGNSLEVVEEMRDIMLNYKPNIKKGYFDFVITLSEEDADKVTTLEQGQKIVEEFMSRIMIHQIGLQEMEYKQLQWIAWQHDCTDNNKKLKHWHILANRVLPNGKLLSDSYVGMKAAKVANEMSRQYGLSNAMEISRRNKNKIRQIAFDALRDLPHFSYEGFKIAMAERGVVIRDALNSKGQLQVFYFKAKSGTEYKASEIDRCFTLKRIRNTYHRLQQNKNERKNYQNNSQVYLQRPKAAAARSVRFSGLPVISSNNTRNAESEVGGSFGKSWDDMTDEEKRLASKGLSI
ncbi:hypothetical protein J4864_00835 [Prevotella multiformis]|uniref:relaxase/mobilization nuclease domain-containing protein n=1 Tax=Prevotella multiformis TaxID=282402 RepID=UPI001BAD9BF6|nr:hypothetical protein [Prevotella multiformis]QUB70810.1 hypothetical protein J4864_00835 [Prevotella multiformis]